MDENRAQFYALYLTRFASGFGFITLAALLECERTANLDLYGSYSSSKYDQVYFNHSRLNADVTATLGTNGEQQAANETDETNETNDANRRTVPSMAAA
ncbi:hypothetical protein [Haladaptatus sp. CMAA 1911]|uniref:hypothetical protein n=1 Tax=unclassified Haladaptatus TaxID=2622732 RepID=UPI0037541003